MSEPRRCIYFFFLSWFPRDGRSIPDGEITGMLIAILLAGQHTSSTTGAWLGFFLARDKALQERVYREQLEVCGEDLPPLSFDQLKDLSLLDRCVRETLRLRPPIMTMMRMVRTPQVAESAELSVQENTTRGINSVTC